MYSVYILLKNFESDVETLEFQNFSIYKVTSKNWEEAKKKFPRHQISKTGSHYYIQRDYPEPPPHPQDQTGLGSIPFDSENLMLLLRLFKPGNIVFESQVIHGPNGQCWIQHPYPQVFSTHHSANHYVIRSSECKDFDTFFAEVPTWPGWNSAWFRISRRYFLWGSSQEFNIVRENSADWDLERILDFFIALEAALIPESDFVGRRLRERAAALLCLDSAAAKALKKRLRSFYDIRSTLAHGGVIRASAVKNLSNDMLQLENDVRILLKKTLRCCPADEKAHQNYLKSLYDVSDKERAEKLADDFKVIKTDSIKGELLLNELKVMILRKPQSGVAKKQ